ncbi:MAG TPA: PIN domain-containing protein [Bdellovibrionota bacterium]|nr:PIN domain-containing protein [Bdellovibrionota bacterium]
MNDDTFVDTNVLIYAHDLDAGRKHEIAADLLEKLWTNRRGVLSTQVLQEFYVNVTRKISHPISKSTAREIVSGYTAWKVENVTSDHVLRASELEERHQLSFWDALIVSAALSAGAERVLSEDMSHQQGILGLRIENPFVP